MPLVGEIMGTCSSITLKDGDYAKYLSVHYTTKNVTGFQITTSNQDSFTLGNTSSKTSFRTFTFEGNSLLVGFYGTKLDWQINSIGIIYLDPTCLPELPVTTPTVIVSSQSSALRTFEHIAIGVLAGGLVIALSVIAYLVIKKRSLKRIGFTNPTPAKQLAAREETPDIEIEPPNTHKHLTEEKSRVVLLSRRESGEDEEQSIAHHVPTLDEHEMRAEDEVPEQAQESMHDPEKSHISHVSE